MGNTSRIIMESFHFKKLINIILETKLSDRDVEGCHFKTSGIHNDHYALKGY
jgi:hypothetical protein